MRRKNKLLVQAFQTIVIAVLIATVYLQIGTGQSSQVRRQPVLFFFCVNQGTFGALMVINSFPAERALMLRERAAGTYYASAYFVAKVIVDTLLTIPLPVIFTCITYFIVELQPTAAKFFLCMLLNTLCNLAATSLATMVCALCKTTELSVIVLPLIMELSRLFGGFYLAPSNLPVYFSWLDALSYIKYAYVGLSLNELEGLELTCTPKERLPSGLCPYPDGQKSIDNLGLDYISLGGCIGVLCGYVGFTWIVAFLAVRFIKSN
jgi:ABC-type multidrug transport system permease subunit